MISAIRPLALLLLLTITFTSAANSPLEKIFSQLTPMSSPALSPMGDFLAARCPKGNKYATCVYDMNGENAPIYIDTDDRSTIDHLRWASDQHLLIYFTQRRGRVIDVEHMEIDYQRIYSFNIKSQKGQILMGDLGGTYSTLNNVLSYQLDKNSVLMGVTFSNDLQFRTRIYEVDLNTGKSEKINNGSPHTINYVYSASGELLATEHYNQRTNRYWINRESSNDKIFEIKNTLLSFSTQGLHNDEQSLAFYFDDGKGAMSLDLDTGKLSPLLINEEPVHESGSAIIDQYTNQLIGFNSWNGSVDTQQFKATLFKKVQAAISKALGQPLIIASWNKDRSRFLLKTTPVSKPSEYYLFNRKGGMVDFVASNNPFQGEGKFGETITIQYEADDGLKIHSFLTLPVNKTAKDKPFPLIILPHGGPASYDDASYDQTTQYLSQLGYSVFRPNFRGSTGYGATHLSAGFGEFGGKMITDIHDGYRHLIDTEWVEDTPFCIIGSSYGGYAALQLSLRYPDSINCTIAINAVNDPIHLNNQYHRGGIGWDYLKEFIGETETPKDIKAISPYENTNQFSAPLLMIHSENDQRVPYIQAQKFAARMEDKSHFSFITLNDQNHFIENAEDKEAVLIAIKQWLNKYYPINSKKPSLQ